MKRDPFAVVKGVHEVLKPGGIFAAEMGGFLNIVGVRSALHTALRKRGIDADDVDPWYFPTPEAYSDLLKKAGFEVTSIDLVPRITPLPTGLPGWLNTFGMTFLSALTSIPDLADVIDEVCKTMEKDMMDDKGNWTIMYVRLRFKAVKPS